MTRGVPSPEVPRCQAPTRSGARCQRPQAVRGGRCSHHAAAFVPAPRPERRDRVNQRGEIHCCNCHAYLPANRFRWLHPPSWTKPRWASYCNDCQRELDRMRWRGERREKNNQSRLVRQRRQQQAARRERAGFVRDAIGTLQRRGFTKSEIARLAGFSVTAIFRWESGRNGPTTNVSHRLGIVLWETREYPLADAPAYRRRLPHPDLAMLLSRIAPQLAAYPLRDAWPTRRRNAELRRAA